MSAALGLYFHVPFCRSKCPYCDFYSLCLGDSAYDAYIKALGADISRYQGKKLIADTVYIGGGTPSVLKGSRLAFVIESAASAFLLSEDCEISVELNPADVDEQLARELCAAGVNRVSMGVQSGVDAQLRALGRRHDSEGAARAFKILREAGIKNISLDLMLGIPGQDIESLDESIDFLARLAPEHISAYMLKLEPGTPFERMKDELSLPDEDAVAELYLHTVERLEALGRRQYEISNFAKPGFESMHNLKYWDCREYLGFGPSAHGFYAGRRYYYPRNLESYQSCPEPVDDGEGGSLEEYIMLRLRLSEGLTKKGLRERYGAEIPAAVREYARSLERLGLVRCDENGLRLSTEGFLVSNSIIAEIIDRFEKSTD